MTKEAALEQEARAITEGLADPWHPTGCLVCHHAFFRIWTANWDESLAFLRRKFYLWHTMLVFLATKRTEAERDQLSKWMLASICEYHRRERTFPAELHPVAAHTIACQLSLFVTGVAMEELGNDSTRPSTLWPRRRADYFPLGPKVTVESILDWFCFDREYQQHGQLLAVLIQLSRQRVLPVLMRDSNRDRLMTQLLRMLSGANVPTDGGGYTRAGIMRFHHNDVRGAACILHAIMRGHRYSLCDEQRFTRGYESVLGPAVLRTVRMLDGFVEQPHLLDLLLALHFRGKLPRAALPDLAIRRMPAYITDFRLEDDATMRAGGPFAVLLRYLRRMWARTDCLAPDCGRHSHESTTGHTFPLCGRCQFAMYCSRACQKRDWERAGAPHREICDILREVFTFSWMDMDEALFVDACHENNFPVSRAIRLTDWIASVPYRSCI